MYIVKNITDTYFSKVLNVSQQLTHVNKYLIDNRECILSYDTLRGLYNNRIGVSTPISTLFEQMIYFEYVNNFAVVYPISDKSKNLIYDSVPDLLTMTQLVIDLKTAPNVQAINGFRELTNKILLNLSNLIKINDRGVLISDINELHSMYVRGLLVRSYSMSDGWLSPSLCEYIIKCYSLVISGIITKNNNLNYTDQLTIARYFALYMAQKLSKENEDPVKPALFYKCNFLGSHLELTDTINQAASYMVKGMTLQNVCTLVSESGPARLSNFNLDILYRTCSLGGSNNTFTTYMALEYPPYFVYMILNVLSGYKFGSLSVMMKQFKLLDVEGKKFFQDLRTSKTLYENY